MTRKFNEQIVSIDFGNSYCKVGIRTQRNGESSPISDEGFQFDESNICIPTIVGQDTRKGKFLFGTEVIAAGDGVRVYRNWKPLFFEASTQASQDQLKDALVADGHDVEELAMGYFAWLKRQIEPICRLNHGIKSLSQIPVRITLPAFGAMAAAQERLSGLLKDSGWSLSDRTSTIAEPFANAIGVFSQGRNAVWNPPAMSGGIPLPGETDDVMPHYRNMFGQSAFLEAFTDYAMSDDKDPVHWVLVADLGGYTLDFAMLGFNLEDLSHTFTTDQESGLRPLFARKSYALGVMDLDQMMHDALPADQQAAMREMNSDVEQARLETFHRMFYANFQPFRVRTTQIGGNGTQDQARKAMNDFSQLITRRVSQFMDAYQYDRVDQLILTGGGSNIPAVRQALIAALQPGHTHCALTQAEWYDCVQENFTRLEHHLVRGATGLGGTSVYFEF